VGWDSRVQYPFDTHGADIPHHTRNIHQSPSGYSTYPYATQFPPADHPYPMGGGLSHLNPPGPVDPNTEMVFYPSTENTRLRTAQACQKCRTRKAKVNLNTLSSPKFNQTADCFPLVVQW
jgi:hypothetical protein